MQADPQACGSVESAGPQAQYLRGVIALAKDRAAANTAEHPPFAGRGAVVVQRILALDQFEIGRRDRNIGPEGTALRLAALGAVTELDRRQFALDLIPHCAAEASAQVAHNVP